MSGAFVFLRKRPAGTALAALLGVSLLLSGCVAVARNPAPAPIAGAAIAQALPIRFWGDAAPDGIAALVSEIRTQRRAAGTAARPPIYLALSGGGSDGAFGAGFLVGWSEHGGRPTFDAVTGISTGAIIAPFAFLGPDYDSEIEEAYTMLSSDEFFQLNIIPALTGRRLGLSHSAPFKATIARFADQQMLDEIGREHRRGRRLFIGTTQLDAQRPVIWNIGALAVSDTPDKLELFREIIRASASIPGVFEPVLLPIATTTETYDELHVDGGVTTQIFLYPGELSQGRSIRRGGELYIIRNGKIAPEYEAVRASIPAIAGRAASTLIKYQGIGDLIRLYTIAKRDGLEYKLAVIPDEFMVPSDGEFDLEYMRPLFALGEELGQQGYDWANAPPGVQ